MKYPPVTHKIPELFQLIIELDNTRGLMKAESVADFKAYKEVRAKKFDCSSAAENFIKRQKKGA